MGEPALFARVDVPPDTIREARALLGRPPIDLVATLGDDGLVVAVVDGGRGPAPGASGPGLEVVDHLADEWGMSSGVDGTAVWFRLRPGGAPRAPRRG